MRLFLLLCAALLLAVTAFAARAQAVITVIAQTCNVANTACVLQGDGGQVITIDPVSPGLAPMVIDGTDYALTDVQGVVVTSTLYRRVIDLTYTFSPTAVVEAEHILARSGSGRGGWAWHSHYLFLTVTVY